MIDVCDTGVGISPEAIPKLFKVEEKYTTVGLKGERGTGLGLPVCYEIMQKHGGSISVESEQGKGTVFHLTFSNQDLENKLTILIVDDDRRIRVLHARYVKKAFPDASVLQARDGKEALTLAREHRPRLIVSDYAMPTMDGFEFLTELNKADKKIITIEDPIEYQIRGITQIQVHPKIDLSFSRGLRSMLRHDPDIMMVGEIRDFETAEITIRVALTGHLVFSTLHTNDAAGAVARLVDMGVEPYLVASSVECIIAQRLVRTVCPHCKELGAPAPAFQKEIGALAQAMGNKGQLSVGRAKGCNRCKGTGYHGRTAIHEILVVDDDLRGLIVQRVPANAIREKAIAKGMRTLRQDGWRKALLGETSIDEVLRVTQENEMVD